MRSVLTPLQEEKDGDLLCPGELDPHFLFFLDAHPRYFAREIMKNSVTLVRTLNALMALVIMGVLSAAYYQQYFKHEIPCPLCLLQRLGMIGVATGLLMNLRFGVSMKHYALSYVSAILGSAVALLQLTFHVCPDFPPFGLPVFGISLYGWSFIVFGCSIIALSLFLFLYSPDQAKKRSMNFFEWFAMIAVFGLTLMNVLSTFEECGFGLC